MTTDRQPPHHRNTLCYTRYQCRRPNCVDRYNQANRERLAQKANGTYDRFVDAQPVREHVQSLLAAGASSRGIATAADVNEKVVRDLLPPRNGGRRKPAKHRLFTDNARKVLAVRVEDVTPPSVDATGTVRRVQALIANGWTMGRLAEQLGMSEQYVWELLFRSRREDAARVLGSTARRIADRYNDLHSKRPTRFGITPSRAAQARRLAAANRWPAPKYWADRMDVIDDPDFEPLYGVTRREIVAQDAGELIRWSGLTRETAAERLGVSKSYVEHAFRDHPQYAVEVAA